MFYSFANVYIRKGSALNATKKISIVTKSLLIKTRKHKINKKCKKKQETRNI